jgi:hypothetical protein
MPAIEGTADKDLRHDSETAGQPKRSNKTCRHVWLFTRGRAAHCDADSGGKGSDDPTQGGTDCRRRCAGRRIGLAMQKDREGSGPFGS